MDPSGFHLCLGALRRILARGQLKLHWKILFCSNVMRIEGDEVGHLTACLHKSRQPSRRYDQMEASMGCRGNDTLLFGRTESRGRRMDCVFEPESSSDWGVWALSLVLSEVASRYRGLYDPGECFGRFKCSTSQLKLRSIPLSEGRSSEGETTSSIQSNAMRASMIQPYFPAF